MQSLSVDQFVGQNVGNYHVARLLGRGRLSAVYLAQHLSRNTSVALTTYIFPERFSAEARGRFMQRFLKASAVLVTLDHPHILPVHEYGEQSGYPYLVTPYMMNGSLADVLKRQGRCEPEYVLDVLRQVASGLDYAYDKGVAHGTLKPANILLSQEETMLVAGFGLMNMLQVRGIERNDQPNAHLLSIADTFLCASEYIAPEVAQGQPVDRRSDIYSLGIILFELLSGKPPFTGSSPMDTAMMHVNQPLPSLHALCPDIPIALESVVSHALGRVPSQRFQRASELVEAFTQVCQGTLGRSRRDVGKDVSSLVEDGKPSAGNFLLDQQADERNTGGWQLMPPVVTGKTFALRDSSKLMAQDSPAKKTGLGGTNSWQLLPPIVTGQLPVVQPQPVAEARPVQSSSPAEVQPTRPPFSVPDTVTQPGIPPEPQAAMVQQAQVSPAFSPFDQGSLVHSVAPSNVAPPQQQGGFGAPQQQGGFGGPQQQGGFGGPQQGGFGAPQQGGFGAPPQQQGGFGAPPQQGGFGAPPQQQEWWSRGDAANGAAPQISRPLVEPGMMYPPPAQPRVRRPNSRGASDPGRRKVIAIIVGGGVVAASVGFAVKFNLFHTLAGGNTTGATTAQTQGTTGTGAKPTTPATQAAKPTTPATQAAKPTAQPTQAPKPTAQPTQPPATHAGTVVGTTALAANSSKVFTNPKDGMGSLLIHGASGTFTAFESACTHEGVTVGYDMNTMTIVCPAHGAIFDPTNGQVLQGPATRPLTTVAIKVNADGTITV